MIPTGFPEISLRGSGIQTSIKASNDNQLNKYMKKPSSTGSIKSGEEHHKDASNNK